jgi:thymidylate synthase
MAEFSDDGETFHGAYGYRWRVAFGSDQLHEVVNHLTDNPDSRRAVVQIWAADLDLNRDTKDTPCNDTVKFEIKKGKLNMMVFNRSNDAIWGAYGANAVHFSYLQEYVSGMLEVGIGAYWQISCNFHMYTGVSGDKIYPELHRTIDPYISSKARPYRLIKDPESFDEELYDFMNIIRNAMDEEYIADISVFNFNNTIFTDVAFPMFKSWWYRKKRNYTECRLWAQKIKASDWRMACEQWCERRGR